MDYRTTSGAFFTMDDFHDLYGLWKAVRPSIVFKRTSDMLWTIEDLQGLYDLKKVLGPLWTIDVLQILY